MKSPHITPRLISALCLIIGCLLVFPADGLGQNRKALEGKRKHLLKEIKIADRLLRATTRNKEVNLNRLVALQSQIKKREELVNTLREEMAFVDSNMVRTATVVHALQDDLKHLEEEYGEIARQAFRQKLTGSKLFFIFSANSLNQVFKRWQYLRQYEDFRDKQATLMLATKDALGQKMDLLESQRMQKENLINTTELQSALLRKEISDKNRIVSALQKEEKKLRQELDAKRRNHEQLNVAIENVIQKELVAARKQARNPDAINKKPGLTAKGAPSAVNTALNNDFNNNKGQLPWPVSRGVITGNYGKQPHPTIKSVQITNNGIDIQTSAGENVRSIFNGEVAGVQYIPGNHYMVIIKHGEYYTVYSNLESVKVSKGDQVSTKDVIGQLHINQKTNTSEVHFEVWKNKTRMNPVRWIRR